jgi:hypothetical protein
VNNTILIAMKGHITCSKGNGYTGIIHDTFDCRDREVESVWVAN